MSFIVRQVARTADGREIVRPRRFDQPSLSVGRSTECDIHLPDLAVTLRHAAIQQISPSQIEVAATAGLPFEVDDRSTERQVIEVARGANIRIGSHVIAVSRGEGDEADAVILKVERVGAVSDASEEKEEARAFSLAGKAPSKRAMAWTLIGLVLAGFLIWPLWSFYTNSQAAQTRDRPIAFHPDEMWSSGKLSLVHANLENNCKACHAEPGVAVRDTACATCHTSVHDHADPRRLAASMPPKSSTGRVEVAFKDAFNHPEGRCVDCHTEHEGATAMPVTAQKFCSDCHGKLKARLTDTTILDAGDFGEDHPQFRPAVMTSSSPRPIVQRLSLDARPIEDSGLKFPHDVHLSATNGVARMAQTMQVEFGFGKSLECADCHVPEASGNRFRPIRMEQNCQMCHSLAFDRIGGTIRTLRHGDPRAVVADLRAFYRSTGPTRPINLGGMRRRPGDFAAVRTSSDFQFASATRYGRAEPAIRAVFSEGGACFDCHRVTSPAQSGTGTYGIVPVRLPERYMRKGWFDHAAHETETCESCHAARTSGSAGDVLLPKIASCRECHGGESAHKEVKSSCAMCHDFHRSDAAPLMVRDSRQRGKRAELPRERRSRG